MTQKGNPSFQFRNQVSPRYVEPLLLQLQYDQWYSTAQFIGLLRSSGLNVKGNGILTELGKQLVDTYSTNSELFYDLMHFLFYSTYHRSNDVRRGRFWLYASVCDRLWQEAPAPTDKSALTNRLQIEIRAAFPGYDPSFSEISVGGVFSWLQTLVPPFLSKQDPKSQWYSTRRSYCTPQLFHLATALIYTTVEGLQYGASLAINEQHIEAICKACLLDTEHFWNMADLTQMTVKGYEMRRGQWGTSVALEGPPAWITLPDFSNEKAQENISEFEDGGEE